MTEEQDYFDKYIMRYIISALCWVIAFFVYPVFWIHEKYEYYSKERIRLKKEIAYLNHKVKTLEEENKQYRYVFTNADYWQSECARLRRLLSSKGYSKKRIDKFKI